MLLALPATIAMLVNHPGTYVGDSRFEQYWAPGWRIVRETMLWDGTRGMGRVGEEFWPVNLPVGLLRGLGLSPAATEHTWHALLLLLAGLGALSVVRVFQPRIGGAHLIAGLAYMCNPYAITYLVPSLLFASYALTPWLLVVAIRGLRASTRRDTWRWAAAWALLVFAAGDMDLPGLFFAVLWLVPVVVFAVAVERWVSLRAALAWVARAAGLSLAVSAAAMVKAGLGAGALAQRLASTENPASVSRTSSWTESFRGLGFWLSYFNPGGRDRDVPGSVAWYESAGGVLITFVLPVLAMVVLWRLRWRSRLLFMAIALPSLVVMVGAFPPTGSHPAGRLLLAAYRAFPPLSSLRTTYKAGPGLMLAVGVLVGIGASALGAWAIRKYDPWVRPAGAAALVGVIGLSSLPLWTGTLYAPDKTLKRIPNYWTSAARWVDAQPGDARVLVLPGSERTAYRWGWAGDDILDTLFRRHPNVVPTNFPLSGAITADVIDALEQHIKEGTLTAEMLVPIAQRLGIGYVLLRNDLDWARIREPRPALLDSLRGSRVLPLAESFGKVGEMTTATGDVGEEATSERKLPPIEIYRVPGMANQDLTRSGHELLIDGSGEAWPGLAVDGLLEDRRPLRFAGAATDQAVADALKDVASLTVTDTNRRRLTLIRGPGPSSSETLADHQDLTQPTQNLFERPGTQTVAVYPDADEVSASGSGDDTTGFSPSLRAANAFDGLGRTAWADGGFGDAVGRWIRVDLRKPQTLSSITLSPLRPSGGGRVVSRASINFSEGPPVRVDLPSGQPAITQQFPARATRSIEIRIEATEGKGRNPVGFREISLPGINLQEFIASPTHLFTSTNPSLRSELASADVSYRFRRSIGAGEEPEELRIRRQFMVAGNREWNITAQLSPDEPPLDSLVDSLVGGPVGAYGSALAGRVTRTRGGLAVDGDPSTSWAGPPRRGTNLTVRFPSRRIDSVRISVPTGPGLYPARTLKVRVGNSEDRFVDVVMPPGCEIECTRTATLKVPATEAATVRITLPEGDGGARPFRISEVALSGPDGAVPIGRMPATPPCANNILTVDTKPVAVQATGDVLRDLEAGSAVLTSCRPVGLAPGAHRLVTADTIRIDQITVAPDDSADAGGEATSPIQTTVTRRSSNAIDLKVNARSPGVVVTGQSYDPGWQASANGRDLGSPFELEGQSAWKVPAGTTVLHLRFGPQRWYSVALALTAVGLVLCGWLLLRRNTDHPPHQP